MDTVKALTRAAEFLCQRQDERGGILDSAYDLFNVWETTVALKSLASLARHDIVDVPEATIERGLHYLRESEVRHGFITHNRRREYGDAYCVETTSEYIIMLGALGRSGEAKVRAQALASLQEDDGTWNIVNPDVPESLHYFPSVTAFALLALHYLDIPVRHPDAALEFLRGQMDPQGAWGVEWEYYGTPHYPLVPITNILALNGDVDCLAKTRAFLLDNRRRDGAWFHQWHNRDEYIPSASLQTALALQSCRHCGVSTEDMRRSVTWLQNQQNEDGSFDGGHFPLPLELGKEKDESIYATSQAIIALLPWAEGAPP